jgi:iron complex transport system substrate-binding protein
MILIRFTRRAVCSLAAVATAAAPVSAGYGVGKSPNAKCAPPGRVVSLSPTATEMLFAVGAGKQVVAVDDQSNYPDKAPRTKLSGFKPNAEAVIKYKPDLVVISNDANNLVKTLRTAKVRVVIAPAAIKLTDTYRQIGQIGGLTCNGVRAKKLVAKLKERVAAIVAEVPAGAAQLSYFHELDNTLYSVTSKTFIGDVYSRLRLRNIADEADTTGSGYPQVSAEFLIAKSPDLIFLADTKCCAQTAETVAARPGWSAITAVKKGNVIALDDDVASRWGPRTVDFLATVAARVKSARAA